MKNKIKSAFVLLMAFVLVMSTGFLAVPTYARYRNTLSFKTVLEVPEAELESDIFSKDGNVTVLLGTLKNGSLEFEFKVTPVGSSYKGTFDWVTPKDINLEVKYEGSAISKNASIDASTNAEKTFTVKVKDISESNSSDTTADFSISWGEMKGNFRVIIPKKEKVDVMGDSSEESIPEENPEQPSENTGENPGEVVSGQGTKLNAEAPSRFDKNQLLPVKIDLPEGTTKVTIDDLPAKTKYKSGNNEYMLWFGGTAEIKNTDGVICFDFSSAELAESNVTISAKAFSGEAFLGSAAITSAADAQNDCSVSVRSVFEKVHEENPEQNQVSPEENPEETLLKEETLLEEETPGKVTSPLILSVGKVLEVAFPEEWNGEDYLIDYYLSFLKKESNGNLVYEDIPLEKGGSSADEEKNKLTLELKDQHFSAGTYLLKIEWRYKNFVFYETEITFFINYSDPSFSMTDDQEVPNG